VEGGVFLRVVFVLVLVEFCVFGTLVVVFCRPWDWSRWARCPFFWGGEQEAFWGGGGI
jgi:hypothetical protein